MKPIIGIVSRPGVTKNDSTVHSVEENIKNAVILSGGIPFMILPTQSIVFEQTSSKDMKSLTAEELKDINRILSICNGFIIPGGYKVYEYDYYICKYAFDNNIPILGICAGMQAMAKANYKDNYNELIPEENHFLNDGDKHKICISKNTLLYKIIGKEEIEVNSYHKYRIHTEGINIASAKTENTIEAIEYNNNDFYLGVQWHPEKNILIDENSQKIFKYFIRSAKKNIISSDVLKKVIKTKINN